MAYPSPYPMPVPSPMAMALAFPDHAPSYHAPPPKYEPPVHVPVHKGYEEVLGRVKMQVGVHGSYAGGVFECYDTKRITIALEETPIGTNM